MQTRLKLQARFPNARNEDITFLANAAAFAQDNPGDGTAQLMGDAVEDIILDPEAQSHVA